MRKLLAVSLTALLGCTMADFRAAEGMLRQRKYYNAIELFISFVREHPDHRRAPEALYQAGNIQQTMLNEPEKAAATYRKLVGSYPVNDYTILAQRKVADIEKDHVGDLHQAIIEYEKLLKAAPDRPEAPEAQLEIARCYTQLHNFHQAAIEFRSLVETYPSFAKLDEVYLAMGDSAYIAGNYGDAIAAYETIEKRHPQSPLRVRAIFGIAQSYEGMDDLDNAQRRYKEIEKEYPSPRVVAIRLAGIEKRKAKKEKPDVPVK